MTTIRSEEACENLTHNLASSEIRAYILTIYSQDSSSNIEKLENSTPFEWTHNSIILIIIYTKFSFIYGTLSTIKSSKQHSYIYALLLPKNQ